MRRERKSRHPQDFLPQSQHTDRQRRAQADLGVPRALPKSREGQGQKQRGTGRDHSLHMEGDSSLDQCGCHGDERALGSECLSEAEPAGGPGRWDGKRRRHIGCLQDFWPQ